MGNIRPALAVAFIASALSILACNPGSPPEPVVDEAAVRAAVQQRFDGLVDAVRAVDAERYLSFFDQERFSGLAGDGSTWHSNLCAKGRSNFGSRKRPLVQAFHCPTSPHTE